MYLRQFTALYFQKCIDLRHIYPPDTADGFDGSHHPRYAECSKVINTCHIYPFPSKPWFLCVCSTSLFTVGKGDIARNKQFLLFPQCFFETLSKNFLLSLSNLKMSFANPFSLEESKIYCLVKG